MHCNAGSHLVEIRLSAAQDGDGPHGRDLLSNFSPGQIGHVPADGDETRRQVKALKAKACIKPGRNRPDVVKTWSDEQVAIRWLKVFPGRRIEDQLAKPTDVDVKQLCADKVRLKQIRLRLSDVSWFMKALAEPIARMANKHDGCTGRFWEG